MRRKLDQYFTPTKAVAQMLDNLEFNLSLDSQILEPCNGEGAISKYLKEKNLRVITNDIDQNRESDFHLDVADPNNWDLLPSCDWVITNPPFNLAPQIIENSFNKAKCGVIALLRLTFLEPCKNRVTFLQNNPPSQLLITKRISFTGDGSTDNATTAWFIWSKNEKIINPIKVLIN